MRTFREPTRRSFLKVDLSVTRGHPAAAEVQAALNRLLCAVEMTPGIVGLVRDEHHPLTGDHVRRVRTYATRLPMDPAGIMDLRRHIQAHVVEGVVHASLDEAACLCEGERCCELCQHPPHEDSSYVYSSPMARLLHTYPDIRTKPTLHGQRILQIVEAIDRIDPLGLTDFDARRNIRSAIGYGCDDVADDDVRDPVDGLRHRLEAELKTVCFLVSVRDGSSFLAVVNLMAPAKLHNNALRRALATCGLGHIRDFERADIKSLFGVAKGEVQPLLFLPRHRRNAEGDPN